MTDEMEFSPYQVTSSQETLDEVMESVNRACYFGYGNFCQGQWSRIRSNPVQAYHRLLSSLLQRDDVEFLPFREIMSQPRKPDRLQIVIRHDVDIDVAATLSQAKVEQELGIQSTFFFLHTAPYHAEFNRGQVIRRDAIANLYLAVQSLGHEVALHTDPMHVYQEWNMDGASALETELKWMRSVGLDVVGTVQHNSAGVYGVENLAIFKGRETPDWKPAQEGDFLQDGLLCFKGKKALYHCLDEKELGLTYEGTDLFKYGSGRIEYGATRHLNRWRWNMHLERYRENPHPPLEWFADEDTVIRDTLSLPTGTLVILSVHPCYYGCRQDESHGPIVKRQDSCVEHNADLGWRTYRPNSVHCHYLEDGLESRQGINLANDLGMLDFSWPESIEKEDLRILVLGGENADARHLGFEAHCHAICERLLRAELSDRTVYVRKLAHPSMGLDRLWGWYQTTANSYRPNWVVLPVGPVSIFDSLRPYWQAATGVSPLAWSGNGLWLDSDTGTFRYRLINNAWPLRQMTPRRPVVFTAEEWNTIYSTRSSPYLGGMSAMEYLQALYRHTFDALREKGIGCILMVDGPVTIWNESDKRREKLPHDHELSNRTGAWSAELANSLGVPLVTLPQADETSSPTSMFHSQGQWTAAFHHRLGAELFGTLAREISATESASEKSEDRIVSPH